MFKQFIFQISFIILNVINIYAQDVSNKDRCHRLNGMDVCNAATQSGCSWCTEEWGCMLTGNYDVISQTTTKYFNCPEACIEGDTECYRIMSDSNMLKPFLFNLSTRDGVCHLQHTNEYSRLYNIHCDSLCRKALMKDFGYCQFYDDNGKEFKDYNKTGAIEKKGYSGLTITLIVIGAIVGIIILGLIFKAYLNHHNKILEERRKIELEDSKLENDRDLEAQIAQRKLEMEERQNLN